MHLTNLIFEAIKLAGVRAILSKGWGGIGTEKTPENVYMIGNCPHVSIVNLQARVSRQKDSHKKRTGFSSTSPAWFIMEAQAQRQRV